LTHEVACWIEYERCINGIDLPGTVFADEWSVGPNLAGACWIASTILRRVLESRGYSAGVVYDWHNRHAFVTTACESTLDATMGQFAAQYGFPADIHVDGGWLPHDVGIVPRALIHADGTTQGPSWAGFHKELIIRILRRMGVDELEAI
jgi:hypothetical protein